MPTHPEGFGQQYHASIVLPVAPRACSGLFALACGLPVLSAHLSRDILTRNNIFHVRLSLARKKEEGGLPNQNI